MGGKLALKPQNYWGLDLKGFIVNFTNKIFQRKFFSFILSMNFSLEPIAL